MKSTSGLILLVIGLLLILCCCIVVSIIGISGILVAGNSVYEQPEIIESIIPFFPSQTPEPTVIMKLDPVVPEAIENLRIIQDTIVHASDPSQLAFQFGMIDKIEITRSEDPVNYDVGDRKTFWAFNNDNNQPFQVEAQLGCESDHLYFWIGVNVNFSTSELQSLCDSFENEIYPTTQNFFGSEWSPGVDNDIHIYVLFAEGMGSVGGYFSPSDSYLPEVHEYSNAHEIIFISADYNTLDAEYTYGVLAHEFQHMIHFYQDINEDGWVNEGFSELAALLNGFNPGGMDYVFLNNPDWQLNSWPVDSMETRPSYGSAFLFVTYFLERFGEDLTKELVRAPENGLAGVDKVLADNQIADDTTGQIITAEDVFADWAITNFINDSTVSDGRYAYKLYSNASTAEPTETFTSCETGWHERQVNQFGTDYISIDCSGSYRVEVEGSTMVDLLPAAPYSGNFAFWSNWGNDSSMTLTRSFDLTQVDGEVEMTYWTWYDTEVDYDYLYVEVSLDGVHWEILETQNGTDLDPTGNSYGWGYNGKSGDWVEDYIDLSPYAGQEVQVRFEYVTDAAVNGEGFLVDDIAIPQIEYSTDFESDDGGWVPDGFVRISSQLPQSFRVSALNFGDAISVEKYNIESGDATTIHVDGKSADEVVLVVSGTTRFTRTPASYRFRIVKE